MDSKVIPSKTFANCDVNVNGRKSLVIDLGIKCTMDSFTSSGKQASLSYEF